MNVTDTTEKVQEQVLSSVKTAQQNLLDLMKPFAGLTKNVPFADRLPDPGQSLEQWYGFVAEAVAAQKDFAISVADLFTGSPA